MKGIDLFISLSRKIRNYDFYIAGAGGSNEFVEQIKKICSQQRNLKFIGEINGQTKAMYLSRAKAFIMPTHLPDACPTTISEALMSGTPVIGSINGSLPELIHNSVGFCCKTESDYIKAIINIDKIKPADCRKYAEQHYSDVVCAQKHLQIYENMLKFGKVI